MFLQVSLAPSSAPLPISLTDRHIRDIGCIATLGLLADEQRRGVAGSNRFPDVTVRGRIYAGIVGDRVVAETGQPLEVIALAIRQAVEERQRLVAAGDGKDYADVFNGFMEDCLPMLDATVPADAAAGPGDRAGSENADKPVPAP